MLIVSLLSTLRQRAVKQVGSVFYTFAFCKAVKEGKQKVTILKKSASVACSLHAQRSMFTCANNLATNNA